MIQAVTVYRKSTNYDIYLNWESFAPGKWKWGTLKTTTNRAYDVCSKQELLQKELNYIDKVFCANNNYRNWEIEEVLQQATAATTRATTNNSKCRWKESFFITPL